MISKLFEKIELSKLRCQTIVLLFLSRFPPPLFLLYVINFTRRGPFFVCWQHSHTQRIYIWRIILLTKICRSTLHWNRYLYIMQWVLKLWLQRLYLYHWASITSNYHWLYFYDQVTKGSSKNVFRDVQYLARYHKHFVYFHVNRNRHSGCHMPCTSKPSHPPQLAIAYFFLTLIIFYLESVVCLRVLLLETF